MQESVRKSLSLTASSRPSRVSTLPHQHDSANRCTARPFKRIKVPTGPAPYYNSVDGTNDYTPLVGGLPPSHLCSACDEEHPMGWCRLKIAGVEHCGLCGIAHLGHSRTCPHLNDETQVGRLLQTLKESPESREDVEAATKYLRMIRGDLVTRKRKKAEQEMARVQQQHYTRQMEQDLLQPYGPHMSASNGVGATFIPAIGFRNFSMSTQPVPVLNGNHYHQQ